MKESQSYNGEIHSAKLRLVVTKWVPALHFTVGPVVHDELFQNDLASS